ncbi:NB-ARC domains-containing protein [Tanacetum coccineum]
MDHLFNDFKRKGIHAFRDDNELPKGEEISPHLYKAIEESRFLIVVFSKDYASSSWCLRELVKILECKQTEHPKHEVRTIFYDVKPDVVRSQTESYEEAFRNHEVSHSADVGIWKKALSMAADLSGYDLQDMTNGYESKFIDRISKDILLKLYKVNRIGICGISGIGKTTLAKAIYNLMYVHFEESFFCEDVKQQGVIQVQRHMIGQIMKVEDLNISSVAKGAAIIKERMACKPILLVLDDVDDYKQLEALADDASWFGKGSLIIFTGRDKQLLISHGVDEILPMDFLDKNQSLQLFSSYAFKTKDSSRGFEEVAKEVVKYVQGHPLALKVLGRFLYGKTEKQWKSELGQLKEHPNPEIQQVLRLSYDGLNLCQKNILLDIACSFIGVNCDFATSVLDSCNFFPDTNIQVLVDRSLITISSNYSLQMHDLIQAMARGIVFEEGTPGNRSRLWANPSEIYKILSQNQDDAVNFSGKLEFLSNELRLLYWHGCPFELLPSDFYPQDIVVIDLSYSNIKQLWTTPKLRHCCNLTTTPDFSEITNLEELDLEGCVNMVTIHPSIGMLKRLVILNMRDCGRARSFPSTVDMYALQVLNLSGCLNVNQLPQAFWSRWWTSIRGFIWNQQHPQRSFSLEGSRMLKSLNLSFCNLEQVPDGLGGLSFLKKLNLEGNGFTSLPGSLSQLSHLKRLTVDGCKRLEVLPELPHSLETVKARGCISLCSITGSNPIMTKRSTYLSNCPKLFKNHVTESQVSISDTECLDSSVTSQGSTNRFSSFLGYLRIQNNRRGFFRWPGSSIEHMNMTYEGNSIPNWFTNKNAGLFTRIKINSMVNLSHLFYADDAIFLGQWSELNIDSLVQVLDCFFWASGLRINMCKSKIMGVNVEDGMVKNAASKLGCLVLKTPFTYLGTKVGGNMSRKQAWKEVVDKVLSRLSGWKMKLLSIGGRLTLLKSVLGSMPMFEDIYCYLLESW